KVHVSLFLSHIRIFKERSSQRLEINTHHLSMECSFLSFKHKSQFHCWKQLFRLIQVNQAIRVGAHQQADVFD
ncbi:hypothetical protein WLF18_24950, partial [Pseudomonas shirazensis]